ncbi:MAG: AAA family ATPase [Pseudomonadota bacterium]
MAAPGATVGRLSVENYRSIRSLDLELGPLTVVTGANGVGKSTLYRALELLHAAALGDLSHRLAAEGGMPSAMWAGAPWRDESERGRMAQARRPGPVRIYLSAEIEDLAYGLELGLPGPQDAAMKLDPVVKRETLQVLGRARSGRRVMMAERKGPTLMARDDAGKMSLVTRDLWLFETALSAAAAPDRHPELDRMRRLLSAMRFHHQFRADPASPLRGPQPAIMTPSLASDGVNWAAALASLMMVEHDGFSQSAAARAVAEAFPGGELVLEEAAGVVSVGLQTAEFTRPFAAPELSDGTLRFLVLTAALTALRPPPFLALNEPEASLHPNLLVPLGDLIGAAAARTQLLVVTHAEALADHLSVEHGAQIVRLEKRRGETCVLE